MQTSTAILETLDRALRHPGWAYINCWHQPSLLVLPRTRRPEGDGRGDEPRMRQGQRSA